MEGGSIQVGYRQPTRPDQRLQFRTSPKITEITQATMTRPAVEVADLLHKQGDRFIEWLTF
jgi:hypothetical protein